MKRDNIGSAVKLNLQDYKANGGTAKDAPNSLDLDLVIKDDAIEVHTEDGRSVWIELQNGTVRVHSYNQSNDAPLNLEIPLEGEIQIDRHDYDIHAELAAAPKL